MAVVRPYIKLSIIDLEAIFDAGRSDPVICQTLLNELSHRSTERSEALRNRVEQVLARARRPAAPAKCVIEPAAATVVPGGGRSATVPPPSEENMPQAQAQPLPLSERDSPASILAAWTALEALSPQTYRRPADLVNGDGRCVVPFEGDDLPWFRGERSRPNQQLYYQIVLGCIPVDRATDELVKMFGNDEERGRKEREKAALAAVLVDRNGLLLEENAVAISSFGWALPIALKGDLAGLGAWTASERGLVDGLTKQLGRSTPEGEALPLDAATLRKAFLWLVNALGLPAHLYEQPSFVLRERPAAPSGMVLRKA